MKLSLKSAWMHMQFQIVNTNEVVTEVDMNAHAVSDRQY